MTVAELIAVLSAFPQDSRVVVRGYEYGVDDILSPKAVIIALNVNDESYAGPHEDLDSGLLRDPAKYRTEAAVYIGSTQRDG